MQSLFGLEATDNRKRGHERQIEGGGGGASSNTPQLPNCILMEILSRLPVQAIVRSKCVCKTWCELVLDPCFPQVHLSRAPTNLLLKTSTSFEGCLELKMAELNAWNVTMFKPNTYSPYLPCNASGIILLNSCNGLLCFIDRGGVHICNPILGEFITLPAHSRQDKCAFQHCGLGFSSGSNQYKVLRTYVEHSSNSPISSKYKVEIQTLGSNSWRSLADVPCFILFPKDHPTYLNSRLHWVLDLRFHQAVELICSFDFEDEKFLPVLPPSPLIVQADQTNESEQLAGRGVTLAALRGCLTLCHSKYLPTHPQVIDIWTMKQYGVQESWTKDFVIESPVEANLSCRHLYTPLAYLSNGDMVISYACGFVLLSYDPVKRALRRIAAYDDMRLHFAMAFVPTFVSLRDVMPEEIIFPGNWQSCKGELDSSKYLRPMRKKFRGSMGEKFLKSFANFEQVNFWNPSR